MSVRSEQQEDGESTSSSSEPKTDRYGFLLVNGDMNNDSDDPCPELVRHREMKWINLISQWDQTLESSPGQQNWIDLINRDTDRQFPFHEMFQSKDSPGSQQGLLQVLKAYTQFRPDEGYCQAQGPVAAVLLMHMPMEEGVLFDAAILFGVLKRVCPAAYKHMKKQGVEPLMFATDWLMCLYTRHLPFNTLLRVWDLFFCNGVRVLFQVAVVLVRRCLGEARQRKECEGQMETLERLRSVKERIQQEHADAFIQEVCSVPLSLAELQRQTEKELEKWRKERPSSTFDPRDRCHGYYTIWEKGKEKENKKKERLSGNLRAPVMRSHSTLSPAILRKKWRKRGSKTETAEWEGKGLMKQDSDEDERRRASVCGVAGELRAKTPKEFSTHLQKKCNTTTNTQQTSTTEIEIVIYSDDIVLKEDEDDAVVVVVAVPSDTDGGDHKKETRSSASLKEADPQTANIPQETGEQHNHETREEEGKEKQTSRDDQDEEILTHQTQPQAPTQHEKSQLSQSEDSRNNREEDTQEHKTKQEEETWKPEEEVQRNINTQEEEVNLIQQEVEVELNTDMKEQQEQENKINCEHKEEMEINGSEQEEEMHLGSTKEEVIYNCDIQEIEIKTKGNEHEKEVQEEKETQSRNYKQEVEQEEEQEIKADNSEQKVKVLDAEEVIEYIEIQEENELEANSSEQETENQEENEMKANKCEEEIITQLEKSNSEQEVDIEDKEKQANSFNEEEQIKFCLIHTRDVSTDEQQQQEDSKQITGGEPTLKTEKEEHSNLLQTPEDQKNTEERADCVQEEDHIKDDCCKRGNNADVEMTLQKQESEKEMEAQMCDAPEKKTEETITEEEIGSSDNLTVEQQASETVEQSGESEMSQETQDEIMEGNNISKSEHKDPEQTSQCRNPEPPQLDEKNEEAELEINITTESNLVKPPSGANQHPQLRLRRSSTSHTSYPTILSEDTFRDPQQSIKRDSCPRTTEAEGADIMQPKPTQPQSSKTKEPQKPEQKSDKPKRRGLFHRLRTDTPSKSTIPKIIIQDFSEGEEKLSSKERRRRRRMQERKEKEEEKERKKLEKELEREKLKERKKPQTRGKSFQVLSRKHDDDDVFSGRSDSSVSQAGGHKRNAYSESYF
ncbi:TBC1 domain family member 10B [Bagarius yarrelli]|uniref:TBC1 domain family member 10B n=1 Tax=Bagarius yarrelli TaxID=175774 RepID=A0A556V5Q8_BAGYA|nr:TBC1 domain family member 10B [Bagarius yarrelli]